MKIDSTHIYFISDTHFHFQNSPGEAERRQRFAAFLSTIPDGSSLFLLGDIFEFYFEYRTVIHNHYLDIFSALQALNARGIEIHFIGGNHDSWAGSFMRDQLGITIHDESVRIEAQGRVIFAAHGDLSLPGDYGYKLLKAVIRNPLIVAVARWIHPDILAGLAVMVSRGSKKVTKRSYEPLARRVADYALERFFTGGIDTVIMGHIHFPLHQIENGREFVILGDWIEHSSYAVLHEGRITTGDARDEIRD